MLGSRWANIPAWVTRQYGTSMPMARNWWGARSRFAQAGYLAAGGYLSLLLLGRAFRGLTARRGIIRPYPPPAHIQDVYDRIDRGKGSYNSQYGEFGSPVNLSRVLDRGSDRMRSNSTGLTLIPTSGLVQQVHRDRIGHTTHGGARFKGHMRRLYQIG